MQASKMQKNGTEGTGLPPFPGFGTDGTDGNGMPRPRRRGRAENSRWAVALFPARWPDLQIKALQGLYGRYRARPTTLFGCPGFGGGEKGRARATVCCLLRRIN